MSGIGTNSELTKALQENLMISLKAKAIKTKALG